MTDESPKLETEAEQPGQKPPFDPNEQARRIARIPFGGPLLGDPDVYRTTIVIGGRKVIIPCW